MKPPPGEFELIARLCAGLERGRRTLIGPGDDCALLARSRGAQLVTIDSMVEQVHFKLEWTTPEALGARALTVNLSDIAAMGGRPVFCVINLAIRPGLGTRFFDRLYAGLGAAAAAAGAEVVGGNITRADALAITIALWGDAGVRVLRRYTAQPDDEIYVTGTVGDAAAGLSILNGQRRARGAARAFLIARFCKPVARLEAGQRLTRIRPAAAAIDISDGLWQDLGHILERSGVGAAIDAKALPLSSAYRAVMGDAVELALGGGEDYELLFCLRPGAKEAALARRLGVAVRRIGVITRGKRATLAGYNGKFPRGFDQLRATR